MDRFDTRQNVGPMMVKHSNPQRNLLLRNLPIHAEGLLIRPARRADINRLSEWPPYPWPYDVFRFSFSGQTGDDLDRLYDERCRDDSRITLVVDTVDERGYMPFTLDNVVPWGRSMGEYVAMFELSQRDLDSQILGCADGPASFNAEMHDQRRSVVSVDPVYQFSPEQIRVQINRTYPTIMHQLRDNLDDYVWTNISSPEELGQLRMKTMNKFLSDYSEGKNESRYVFGELPILPFGDQTFDLALCSHFLFLYSDCLSAEFHYQAIQQMLRTAREVRVFPLLTLGRQPSPYLEEVSERFRQFGRTCTIKTVDYEFQRGGNQMLRIF